MYYRTAFSAVRSVQRTVFADEFPSRKVKTERYRVTSVGAVVTIYRPMHHTNLTHVAALISFFFSWKVSCFSCNRTRCKQTRVSLYSVMKREELSERVWRFVAPV